MSEDDAQPLHRGTGGSTYTRKASPICGGVGPSFSRRRNSDGRCSIGCTSGSSGLRDEEIVSRYIFVTWRDISGPLKFDSWYFSSDAPSRDEVLEVIGNDYLIPRSTLEVMAAKFDRDGEAAFASKYDVILEIIMSCPDEDDEDDQKEEPNQPT